MLTISDIQSRAEWHRSGIYNDLYKQFESEDQIGVRLAALGVGSRAELMVRYIGKRV